MKRVVTLKSLPFVAATLLILAAGCGRDSVKVYHVETNDTATVPPPPAGAGTMSSMAGNIPMPDNSGLPKLKYTVPAGWEEKAASQLRVASLQVSENGKTADVSVIPLSGMAGGDFANVNRWRGQVGLEPLPETDVQSLAEKVEIASQPAELYDIAGASPGSGDMERILAVILHRNDTAWFFKMTGDADLVKKEKPSFISFLKSVEFGAPTAAPTMDMSQLPPSHPPISGMGMDMGGTTASSTEAGPKPTWTVPAGWEEGQLAQFLVARYVIKGGGDASATVNVSQLAGDGGGLGANVNRWRGQLGQAPISADEVAKLPTIDAAGSKAVVVDFTGTDPSSGKPAQLVGVVLPLNGDSWFYKLMGDESVVAAQKEAFLKFVQSAKYPAGH